MTTAIVLFIIGFFILLLGADKYNPLRDLVGFALIAVAFVYVCLLVP